MKLQQEKHLREREFEDAKTRVMNNEPPSEEAEREWYRLERDRLAQDDAAMHTKVGGGVVPGTAVRTTAEPRPNAYVPIESIGIPKPYGALAPFKPVEPGTTIRHIKKPKASQIEI